MARYLTLIFFIIIAGILVYKMTRPAPLVSETPPSSLASLEKRPPSKKKNIPITKELPSKKIEPSPIAQEDIKKDEPTPVVNFEKKIDQFFNESFKEVPPEAQQLRVFWEDFYFQLKDRLADRFQDKVKAEKKVLGYLDLFKEHSDSVKNKSQESQQAFKELMEIRKNPDATEEMIQAVDQRLEEVEKNLINSQEEFEKREREYWGESYETFLNFRNEMQKELGQRGAFRQ